MSVDKNGDHEIEVHVKSLKTGESVNFKTAESSTLSAVWDEANSRLHETKSPADTFRCADGQDLTGYLERTLAEIQKEKLCSGRHFEIKGPSGGASA